MAYRDRKADVVLARLAFRVRRAVQEAEHLDLLAFKVGKDVGVYKVLRADAALVCREIVAYRVNKVMWAYRVHRADAASGLKGAGALKVSRETLGRKAQEVLWERKDLEEFKDLQARRVVKAVWVSKGHEAYKDFKVLWDLWVLRVHKDRWACNRIKVSVARKAIQAGKALQDLKVSRDDVA